MKKTSIIFYFAASLAGAVAVVWVVLLCAVIDGVINDTYDPSRNGTRCVYGYWTFN